MKNDIRLLIIGDARHGKDTLAELLRDEFGLSFISSSQACADIFIYNELKDKYGYKTPEECFEDRMNHRAEWYQMICNYNKDDKARLAKDILKTSNTYVGMRDRGEIQESLKQGLFDLVIWVDASKRLPNEDVSSFNITKDDADVIIENNRTFEEFKEKILRFGKLLKKEESIIEKITPITVSATSSVINILKNCIIDDEDDLDICEIGEVVVNWPEVKDEDGDGEPLDLENWNIISLTDDKMVMCAGGDWQEGLTFTLIPIENNKLKVIDIKVGFDDGMSLEEILEILNR